MALLEILHFPDPRLRKRARPVDRVDAQILQTVEDMFATMYAEAGIGLAATQVNIQQKIIVIDVSAEKNVRLCLINPQIVATQGEEETQEGCLSVPGFFENVSRAEQITVKALNLDGNVITQTAQGLLAVCIQHEIDHLNGKLFVDYLSPLKRERIKNKLLKQKRHRDDANETFPPSASVL